MTDLEPILSLWRELEAAGADYVLATVVAVEGSSYRRPGARMLLTQDGRRVGTVSGGCLEAEVASRAWWLTAQGPVVERYSTSDDDGERPYGSGCGGMVSILLERRQTAGPLLGALETAFSQRVPIAIATFLDGPRIGQRAFAPFFRAPGGKVGNLAPEPAFQELQDLANLVFARRTSMEQRISTGDGEVRAWADFRFARPGLWIFGAGDDAKPLARLARELGWYVVVADGRSHLATRDRFSTANEVRALAIAELPGPELARLDLRATDAAVVMTHSFEQDSRVLASLLSLDAPLAYLGVLGPQRRTGELLAEAARLLCLQENPDRIERWLAQMHAPTGLDLGAETPAAIALSILAEIQQTLTAATALPLREVRGPKLAAARP
jgi:xanthine/CO dehydrogenase XdhC/CoxF family maturation factor